MRTAAIQHDADRRDILFLRERRVAPPVGADRRLRSAVKALEPGFRPQGEAVA